jgi:hypothetical protein
MGRRDIKKCPVSMFRIGGPVRKKIGLALVFLVIFSLSFAAEKRYKVPIGDSPQLGPKNAPVTVIEFIDFQ